MGYHIIFKNTEGGVISTYVETLKDLAYQENITEDVIIYEGEPHWTPVRITDNNTYKRYLEDKFRAGIKAQVTCSLPAVPI